jgi:TetR/AcrR family transcriptional regulator, regulator of cefoperazone and chloramphenicol sensitivity
MGMELAQIARKERGEVVAAAVAKAAIADERRLSLVRAAYDIIAAEGFERLRTRDVADRVGINVATLHYYFPTKEALIEAVAHYLSAQFRNTRAPGTTKTGKSGFEQLQQEFVDHDYYQDSRPEMIIVMQELNLRAKRDTAIRQIMEPLKAAWHANIATLVGDGIQDGTIRGDVDGRAAASVIVMALWGMGTLPLDAPGRQAIYRAIEEWLSPRLSAASSVSR